MCIQTLVIVVRGDRTNVACLCCIVLCVFVLRRKANINGTFVLADEKTKKRLKIVQHYECATVK